MAGHDFGQRHQGPHHDARPADDGEAAQRRIARVQEFRQHNAADHDRNGAQDDEHREPKPAVGEIAPRDGLHGMNRQIANVRPEITDNRRKRCQLHSGGKCRAGVLPAKQSRHDAHVGCRGNRQQLGDALHDAKHRHFAISERDEASVEPLRASFGHRSFSKNFSN